MPTQLTWVGGMKAKFGIEPLITNMLGHSLTMSTQLSWGPKSLVWV